jgi:hypothetical protein
MRVGEWRADKSTRRQQLCEPLTFLFWWEQILQGLRRLTRPKTFEVDVGMAHRCHPRFF